MELVNNREEDRELRFSVIFLLERPPIRCHKPKGDSILVVNVQLMQNPNGRKEREKGGRERSKANSNGYDWIGSTNYLLAGQNTSPELRQVALSRDFENGGSLITTLARSSALASNYKRCCITISTIESNIET